MRHAHAGLSINDFPLAYGQIIPDTSPATMKAINEARYVANEMPTTATLIWLQMVHRGLAALIAVVVGLVGWMAWRSSAAVRRWSVVLCGMVVVQIVLGAYTIWTDKAADVATAHMALGALTLFVCALLTLRLFAMQRDALLSASVSARRMDRVEVAA
jgi:cytochrome c oxidase assembly protein subunit 15